MGLDERHDLLGEGQVLLGQDGQHVDVRLAVEGQVLQRRLVVAARVLPRPRRARLARRRRRRSGKGRGRDGTGARPGEAKGPPGGGRCEWRGGEWREEEERRGEEGTVTFGEQLRVRGSSRGRAGSPLRVA